MTQRRLDEFPGSALTEDERKELRRMIEDDKKARWLWGTLHRVVIAIGAVAAALTAVKVLFGNFLAGFWK